MHGALVKPSSASLISPAGCNGMMMPSRHHQGRADRYLLWLLTALQLLELLSLSGALDQLTQALTEELWANGGSTKPGSAAARRAPDRHSSSKSSSSGANARTTAKTSSPQAFNLQQASGTVSTLLRLAWQGCALHHYTAIEDIDSIEGFLHTTACLLPLLAPTKQPGQDEDWATALSPLGTEPEAVQALRCLMMDQVMSCAVQLALSVQQPGNHNGFSGTAQQGQPQSLGAETVLQVLEAMSGVGLLAPPLLLRHVPDNPLSVAPAPPAATQASAPTTDYQVQQHLEAAARAAELEEGGRERGSAAQLAAWPPSLRDQVQAQLLCSQAWPAGWVSVVDALVGRMCADIAHTPDLLTLPQLAGILRKLQAAGYAPAQGVTKALLALLALPSAPRLSLSFKTTLVLLVYGVMREPHSLQELDQVLDQQALMRLQDAHVKEYKDARSWEEVWAVPCLALTTRPSPTGSWPESLTQPRTWGSISSLHPMQIIDYGFHASHMKMVPCNTWLLLRQVITVQAAGFPFIGGRTLQSWTQLLLKQLAACANTLYGWRKEVELLRGSLLMTTAEQLVLGDDIASMDDYTVLACQLTGRCSQYLPASHFFQVLGTLYLVSNLAQHITTFAMAGMILAKEDGAQLSYYNCLAGPPQASSATHMLGIWQDIMQQLEPGRLMQQQALQPFCLIPPSAINSLLRLGLRALGSEHGGSSSSGGAVGAARAAGTLEGGAVGKGHDSFIAMLFNGGPQVVGRYDSFWRASLLYAVAKRHPEAEAGLLQQALERLLVSYNAMSIKAIVMPLEALLVVLEPHLCPASPNTAPAPLPEELPIQQWLMMADWSNFQYPSLTTRWVTDDGSLMSEWRSWGPRQWALLFSLWINCPPFKTLFLDCLVEEQLIMMLTRGTAPRSPPPSSDGSRNGRLTGAQALGGQAQPADEPSMQHSPEAPVDPTGLQEAELALALVRMGLPGNMFERGAPLQPDLQQRLVQWGRWEWYIDLLRYYRLGGLHDNDTIPILTLQFAMEREGTCLEAVHLAGCPQDLHTQLRLPKSWPVSNDSISARQLQFWATPALGTSTEQLRQVFMDTADALQQLPGSAAFGPRFMAAVAGIQSHRRKLCEMYAAPRSGSRSGSSSDPGPPWAGDPSPNSPTAFKRDHLLIALLPDMPPVPKHTRASRANGAKTQAGHEAANSMEQLTAAHAALTAAHAAVTADLLSSQQLYSQLRERHCSLMVFAGQRDQQWELDLLGWVQQVEQLEAAFLQQLQATQAQLTDTAAALEAAQKDLAVAQPCPNPVPALPQPSVFDPYGTLKDFLDDILELAAGQPCSPGLRTHLVEFFGAAPSSNHAVESSLKHTKHGNSAKQGLDAMIGSINNKLDPGALANIDLADFEARLLTLRKQKRDKETTSADDNREAKAARKAEESACMVDGNAKMVLNVPTQAPLQQLQQAFQQHARGADYSNTSAKEATRFTREQLRAYLLYHKVPPRDQPVGNTLVAGWQKAVQKHIAERGSPTGHGRPAGASGAMWEDTRCEGVQQVMAPWTEAHVSVVMSQNDVATQRRLRTYAYALATTNKAHNQGNEQKRLKYEESRGQFDYQAT
ncbi:hypothetical protein QJQ45_029723 [Haematococcus lacustris]|nr:hypothetical protein QJQ45_029723 [Haematococcus lacustris]